MAEEQILNNNSMYIYGSFVNQLGDTITVHIVTNNSRETVKVIGSEEDGIFFTDDPVEIGDEVNDTFDVLLRQSATIHLYCGNLIPDFFCTSAMDTVVNIYKEDECLFAGFLEPQSYSQPYNDVYDEIELNCIDALSVLQYSKYKDVGALGVLYNAIKSEAAQRTFYELLTGILSTVAAKLDIVGGHTVNYYYDGSKGIDATTTDNHNYDVFKQLSISDLLFLGDEEDDVVQQDEVVEDLLKYLNLHIAQQGFTFYIFSWESVRSDAVINWVDIISGSTLATTKQTIDIDLSNVADTDTTISIGEAYNQLLLTCKIEKVESIIESPLDDDLLISPYDSYQKYLTEYSSDGEGKKAYRAFNAMTHDQHTDYGAGAITDWYMQVMKNSAWNFYKKGKVDIVNAYCADGTNQQNLPNFLGQNPGAAIIAFGSIKTNTANDDNSPTSKVSMTNYLVVSVNGNEVDNDEDTTYPSVDTIKDNIPYAEYTGNSAGGVFSPADEATINYIVFSGKVILNPIMHMTNTYKNLHTQEWGGALPDGKGLYVWHQTVPSRTNGDGRYYTRQYFKATNVTDDPTWDQDTDNGLCPYTGEGPEQYEFKYSAIGDSSDKISKIAVLSCMLIIGDQCVVETGTDGQPSDFKWQKYKTLEECGGDVDTYYQQSFTLGFNPKIGDKLIGTEFDLQNNISYTMGIDAEGIAVPIKKSDKVSGQVHFMILGPVNETWDEITRRHPTFFRHTKWGSNSVPLLAHVSSIMIKSFEAKIYSDNGLINNGNDDNDVIYMSDTKEKYTNKKDDLEFKINSALTASECKKLGVNNDVKLSTPLNVTDGDGVLTIHDFNNGQQAKAEQLYVDSYYGEYHKPRIIMEQKLLDKQEDGKDVSKIGLFTHYRHPALGKTFFVQGYSRNLMEGRADLTLKEISND